MKISELVRKTNVSKETIHYYVREGALPKPRKHGKNTADYGEEVVEQIQLIKDLQDNYFLPLIEIKKLIKQQKKHSLIDKINFKFLTSNIRPLDQISFNSISGRDNFMKATGIGEKWLALMEDWKIITPEMQDNLLVYSPDNIIIGKLLVAMDRLGFGPKDGYGPEYLKRYADTVKNTVLPMHMNFLSDHLPLLTSPEFQEKGMKVVELTALFLYYIYRKMVREEVVRNVNSVNEKNGAASLSKE